MAILKCKMCGADLNPKDGEKICECEFCGTKQTISTSNDDRILKTISRGNSLRNKCEFDKAFNLFNQLVAEGCDDAEIYWNLVLCKYGITYVDDYDGNKKPTINRMSNVSILEDEDYKKTIELADVIAREQYKYEANDINNIQNKILEIVSKEEPYDIFISYKETDEFGDRTKDSVLAYDIYEALTKEGYRVFLSRITLSKVIGKSYEPYIYSALYSAKIMILVSTSEDYINSVWVKNEWSRFLSMMQINKEKVLIPCFKDMDPYDLPKELRNIQSVDLSKLGAIQDLKEASIKFLKKNSYNKNSNLSSTIKRIQILIFDHDFDQAKILIDSALVNNPDNCELYGLSIFADYHIDFKLVEDSGYPLSYHKNYKHLLESNDETYISKYQIICNKYFEKFDEIEKDIDDHMLNDEFNNMDNLKANCLKINKLLEDEIRFMDSNSYPYNMLDSRAIPLYKKITNKFESIFSLNVCESNATFTTFDSSGNEYYLNLLCPFYFLAQNKLRQDIFNIFDVSLVDAFFIRKYNKDSNKISVFIHLGDYACFKCETDLLSKSDIHFLNYILNFLKRFNQKCRIHIDDVNYYGFPNYKNNAMVVFEQENGIGKINSSMKPSTSQGCYIATCVYGSYDCPEVWRLRRYRDYYLDCHWWGRAFIKIYYAISPTLVKWFGNKHWFREPMKKLVDAIIEKAKLMGFKDTNYEDKY